MFTIIVGGIYLFLPYIIYSGQNPPKINQKKKKKKKIKNKKKIIKILNKQQKKKKKKKNQTLLKQISKNQSLK